MTKYYKYIIIIFALMIISAFMLAGCAAADTKNDNTPIDGRFSSAQYDTQITQDTIEVSEGENSRLAEISKETDKYSVVLSHTVFSETNEKLEISPSTLEVMNKSTGEKYMPDSSLYLGISQSNDKLVIEKQPNLDIMEFQDWYLIAVRVPRRIGNETVHTAFLYFFNDNILQILGNNIFFPVIPADSRIKADIENNCFEITDTEGNTERYTVVYDQYDPTRPYCLRSADYVPEPVVITHRTKHGDISFSYNVYERTETGLIISRHNFIELNSGSGEKLSCEVRSPVYQGGSSYDGLTDVDSPIGFEVMELSEWSISAVRVPYMSNGKQIHSVILYCFDNNTLQLLGDGYFIPDIPADSEITADADNNLFSIINTDGVTNRYTIAVDTENAQRIIIQPV